MFRFLTPILLLLATSTSAMADVLTDAIVADITPEGLNAVTALVPELIPLDMLEIPDQSFEESSCTGGWIDICLYEIEVDITNISVDLELLPESIQISPSNGVVYVAAYATITANSPDNPLYIDGEFSSALTLGIPIGLECDVWVNPFSVVILTAIVPEIVNVDGEDVIQMSLVPGALEVQVDLQDSDIQTDCGLFDFLVEIGIDAFSPSDLLGGAIDEQVAGIGTELEDTLSEFVFPASFSQDLDLLGTTMSIDVGVAQLDVVEEGIRAHIDSSVSAEPHDCVAMYDVDPFETPSEPPALGEIPPGISTPPHVAAIIDDDFINQLTYTAWNAGLLCFTISEDSNDLVDLPIPLNTSMFDLLAPGVYEDLFPQPSEMVISTRPTQPPLGEVMGNHAIDIYVDGLGVDFFAELDGRMTRLIGMGVAAELGVDLSFDGVTGTIAAGIDLSTDGIETALDYNELKPESSAQIEGAISGVLDLVLGPLLGDFAGDFAFPLPTFGSLGLDSLALAATGTANDRLGLYTTLGTDVPYAIEGANGCDPSSGDVTSCSEGCDIEGGDCDDGCSTGVLPARGMLALIPLLLGIVRRRQHQGTETGK